ncbi:MAG: YqjF family protein [Saprospiraceae bacterium]
MKTFLKTEWRNLIIINYTVDPAVLHPYLPSGTELDIWNNQCYVSLLAFRFMNTRVLGIKMPLHINFTQINFRFYVKHQASNGEWRQGAVFLREIVSLPVIAAAGKILFNQPYHIMPTKYSWGVHNQLDIAYAWKYKGKWNRVKALGAMPPEAMTVGSEAEFITEHYWGYTKINAHKTLEFKVEHPRWRFYPLLDFAIDVDFKNLYGVEFELLNRQKPHSVFLAEGAPAAMIPMGKIEG